MQFSRRLLLLILFVVSIVVVVVDNAEQIVIEFIWTFDAIWIVYFIFYRILF